ncbi:MAG: hypothetical protein WDM90_24980 [Ferruginibacter sp.]
MNARILSWIGMAACVALIISCFIPWAYYADAHIPNEAERTFTGFFSYQSQYGKPGRALIIFTVIIFICILIPKVWAKRTNLFLSGLCWPTLLNVITYIPPAIMRIVPKKEPAYLSCLSPQ